MEKLKTSKWWIVSGLAMAAGWGLSYLFDKSLAGDCVGWFTPLVSGAASALAGALAHVMAGSDK